MKLCIILHCILLSGYSPAASFNIQLQGITVRAPTTLFFVFSYISFLLFFLVDVSTPSLGADPPVAACTGGLHPGGTAPQL